MGQGPDSWWKKGTDLYNGFHSFLIVSPEWESNDTLMLILHIDINVYVGKFSKQRLNVWLFSNPGDKILFLLRFYKVRILEWKIYFTF